MDWCIHVQLLFSCKLNLFSLMDACTLVSLGYIQLSFLYSQNVLVLWNAYMQKCTFLMQWHRQGRVPGVLEPPSWAVTIAIILRLRKIPPS